MTEPTRSTRTRKRGQPHYRTSSLHTIEPATGVVSYTCHRASRRRVENIADWHSARLSLQRTEWSDLPDLRRLHRDERVMRTLGGVRSEGWIHDHVRDTVAHWDDHGFGLWVLREPNSGSFVGRGGLKHAFAGGEAGIEVAYALMPEHWGKGLATELARESVRVGFEILKLEELLCFTLTTNATSRRVMESVGFRYERDFVHADLPHILCRLRRTEWTGAKDTRP